MMLQPVQQTPTNGKHGNCLEFSPLSPNLLALVANDHYGLRGCGDLTVVSINYGNDPTQGNIGPSLTGRASLFPHPEPLCCLSWSPRAPHSLVTGSRGGHPQLWNISAPQDAAIAQQYRGCIKELSCVAWASRSCPDHFLTGSWDGTLLMFDPGRPEPVWAAPPLPALVYDVRWSPHRPDRFAAADGSGAVRVWERCLPGLVVPVGPGLDALSCDWDPNEPHQLAAAVTDGAVTVWDLRRAQAPLRVLQGHQRAVNKVRYSPHFSSTLATASYDFTTRVWRADGSALTSSCHTGFSHAVAWSPMMAGVLADCAWDASMALYVV